MLGIVELQRQFGGNVGRYSAVRSMVEKIEDREAAAIEQMAGAREVVENNEFIIPLPV